jgi:hypothetical protein
MVDLPEADKTRQPNDAAGMAVAQGALRGGDLAVAPINVVALLQAVGVRRDSCPRDNAAAGHLKSVHNHKTARWR